MLTRDLMPRQPTLQYSMPALDPLGRLWRWLAVALAALPVAAVGSIHLIYFEEWAVNGEAPIPPFHGPNNPVEAVLYNASAVLLLLYLFSIIADVVLPVVALAKGLRPPLVLVLPAVMWVVCFVILLADPVGAMNFWID